MNALTLILSVVLGGILGNSVDANYNGRISLFINSPESPAIQIYTPEKATSGGWKGEHAGKWLYAASHAYSRTQDPKRIMATSAATRMKSASTIFLRMEPTAWNGICGISAT